MSYILVREAYIANTRSYTSGTLGDSDRLCNSFIQVDVEDLPHMHTHDTCACTHTCTYTHTHDTCTYTHTRAPMLGFFFAKIKSII